MADMHMLSTLDNPYSPLTQWDEWFAYDYSHGYHTPGLLARVTRTSDELSEVDQDIARETAIDEIIQENILGNLIKVKVPMQLSGDY